MSDFPWERETFDSVEKAEGFAEGLTYGDDPQFEVDAVEPCKHDPNEEMFDVIFRRIE